MDEVPTKEQMRKIWRFRMTNMCYGCAAATIGFHVLLLQSQGLPASTVGIVMSVNAALSAIAPPIWGLVADKLRSRYKVFLISAMAAALLSGFIAVSTSIRIMGIVISAFLIPIMSFFRMPGFSMLDAMAMGACQQIKGVEFSSIRVWRSIGMSGMSMLYSLLTEKAGVEIVFVGFAVCSMLVFLMRKNLCQFEPVGRKSIPLKDMQISRLFKNYYLSVFLILNLLLMVPLNCYQFLAFLITDIGGDTSVIGLIGGIRTAANVLVMFAAPHLKRKVGMPVMMMMASGLFMLEAMLFQLCNSTFSILLICMLGGAAMGLNFATGVNYISLMAPKGLEATSISLYAIGAPTMGIIASVAGGQIITYFGSRAIFLFAFGAVCLWLIIFLLSFYVGRHIFKKEPPVPLLLRPLRFLRKKST